MRGLSARTTQCRRGWRWLGTCRTSFLCVAAFCSPPSVCFKNARSTDTITLVSRVSRNTIKKTGQALSAQLDNSGHCFGPARPTWDVKYVNHGGDEAAARMWRDGLVTVCTSSVEEGVWGLRG